MYTDHDILTPDRRRDLAKILDGAAPAVNRERFAWLCRRGYLIRGAVHANPAARWVVGTELAYAAFNRPTSDAALVVYMQHGGYRMRP